MTDENSNYQSSSSEDSVWGADILREALDDDNDNGFIRVDLTPPIPTIAVTLPRINSSRGGNPTGQRPFTAFGQVYNLSDADDTLTLSSLRSDAAGRAILALSGRDVIQGTPGPDVIYGQQGSDSLDGGSGNDILFGGQDSDRVTGGAGNDFVAGSNDNDTLIGLGGNDTVQGGKGDDILDGGAGDDLVSGDRGQDFLTGGEGSDTFFLGFGAGSPVLTQADVITDFRLREDKLGIERGINDVRFERIDLFFNGSRPTPSTAIRSGDNYLGMIFGVTPEFLSVSDIVPF